MRLSIVSINSAPESTGVGVYTAGMTEFLATQRHDVVVHPGSPVTPSARSLRAIAATSIGANASRA
jgi:hypothetical protein